MDLGEWGGGEGKCVQEGQEDTCQKGSKVGFSTWGVSALSPCISEMAASQPTNPICPPLTCSQATGGAEAWEELRY